VELGTIGVWWSGSWRPPHATGVDVAAELESLGYGAIWSSGGFDPGVSPLFGRLLDATQRLVVASGILSIWLNEPAALAAAVADLEARHPGRFLTGLGVSHAPLVEQYRQPYTHMAAFLDGLDGADTPVPPARRVLAALGPRMLELAARRSAGAHPYLVPIEHTARARRILGPGPLLAPEVTVVLEPDPAAARQLARGFLAGYLTLPNYRANLRSLGFGDAELAAGGSDRLVDAVVAWGDVDAVATRVRAHLEAGADHVCVQVVPVEPGFPLEEYRALARALLSA